MNELRRKIVAVNLSFVCGEVGRMYKLVTDTSYGFNLSDKLLQG